MTRGSALLSLALAGTSCGLLSHDPGSAVVPSDGVGEFGVSAPVELCVGTARVVAAAASTEKYGNDAVCTTS